MSIKITEQLTNCKLWEGSVEQLEFKYTKKLSEKTVNHRISTLKRLAKHDELSVDEIKYLTALEQAVVT